MTLEENEQEIYDTLEINRLKLYITLLKHFNSDTNSHFYNSDEQSVYSPILDSSLEVTKAVTNNNAFVDRGNGVVSLKGAVLKNGWPNTLWEMSVDVRFDDLKYTGLILLADANNPFKVLSPTGGSWGIRNWEGPVTGTPCKTDGTVGNFTKTPDTTLSDGSIGVPRNVSYTLHMKKTSLTTLEVWKNNDVANKVVYEWDELSDVKQVTFGANTNYAAEISYNLYGSLFISNLNVTYYPLPDNYKIINLCEDTKKIKSDTNNVATVPGQPTTIQGNNLGTTEQNILNKVQYCNNVLRYTLRKNGIDFNNSNKMHELIKYIDSIEYNYVYFEHVLQNMTVNNNGNLDITEYAGNVYNETLVTNITLDNNGNLVLTKELIDDSNINNVILNLDLNNNGNLVYDRIGDYLD